MAIRWFIPTVLLALCRCTYPTEAGSVIAGQGQAFSLVRSRPAPGQNNVSPDRPMDLLFSGPPQAETAVPATIRLFTGVIESYGHLATDLLDQRVRFTPLTPLEPHLRYQVYVQREVSGLNGASLDTHVIFNFTTGDHRRDPARPTPPQLTATDLQPLWTAHCSSCHRAPDPPGGVNLSSPQASVASLRNVVAGHGSKLRVFVGDHARSYLMFKLLGVGGYVGFPMPPDRPALRRAELRRVVTWIDGGATP